MTYEDIGKSAGLTETQLKRYVNYMKIRWSETEEQKCLDGYASEWAWRFKHGQEEACSDGTGKTILKTL